MALTKEQVKEMVAQGAMLVNVLRKDAYDKMHIAGSLHIRLEGDQVEPFIKQVEKQIGRSKTIITYCSGFSCPTGPRAAKLLKEQGFNAEDYPGGLEEWFEAGLPVEGTLAS